MITRALPTAYDPPDAPLTVATPSCGGCACCCCCCLNSAAGAAGVLTAAAATAAVRDRRDPTLPAIVGLLAVPAAIGVGYLMLRHGGYDWTASAIAAGGATMAVLGALALFLAGQRLLNSVGTAVVVTLVTVAVAFAEIYLALATVLVIEFLVPVAVWIGGRTGRRMMGGGDP